MTKVKNKYGLDRFLAAAYAELYPDTSSREGLSKAMQNWCAIQLNTVPWDDRIMNASLEQLLVFYHMHKIKNDPSIIDRLDPKIKDDEDWFKDQMGDNYIASDEEYARMLEEWEKQEAEKAKELNLPDKIKTDFSQLDEFIDEDN